MEKEKDSSRKGASGMREPANLYEAVIALESWKNRQAAEPPPLKGTLTQEQQEELIVAIAQAISGTDKERNGQP